MESQNTKSDEDGSKEDVGSKKVATVKKRRRGKTKFVHYKLGSNRGKSRKSNDSSEKPEEQSSSQARDPTCPPLPQDADETTSTSVIKNTSSLSATETAAENLISLSEAHQELSCGGGPFSEVSLLESTQNENVEVSRPEVVPIPKPDEYLINDIVGKVKQSIVLPWISVLEEDKLTLLLLSRDSEKSVQRRATFYFHGECELSVHRRVITGPILKDILQGHNEPIPLTEDYSDRFVVRIVCVLEKFKSYEVCVGVNAEEFKVLWDMDSFGEKDRNPYGETRYTETFRPYKCHMIIPIARYMKRRCDVCIQTKVRFRNKINKHQSEVALPNTPNVWLDRTQLLHKVNYLQKDLKYARAQITKLKTQLNDHIKKDGVPIDEDLSEHFSSIFNHAKLTPFQALFIEQQLKAASCKSASAHRWHPSLIRFALLLKSTSSSAYRAARDSGVIKLPSERTLYDYSHAHIPKIGITQEKLDRVVKMLSTQYSKSYQAYHVLAMDEMHVNKKLVYRKSSGEMIGYVNLTDVEQELIQFEAEMKEENVPETLPMASKILTFQVNGVANGVSEVVASFPTTDAMSGESLYNRVWEVIGACERSGIKIISVVSDGASINRSFYNCNPPVTKCDVVFDTVNLCDPSRVIFFFSDVPHLLKTIRNCFYKSGYGPGCTRLLTKNNQVIVWKTITDVFNETKGKTLRTMYKINKECVYLNSYSVMKVSYAARVMSNAMATYLSMKNDSTLTETVKFIKKVNDWFDMLNGASASHGHRTANENLEPYVDNERLEQRFGKLLEFLDYLREWREEVEAKAGFSNEEKKKMLISSQTMEGIEMTTRSFIGATRFLLKEAGVQFVIPRDFCQDRLERFFGKQRQSGGGSRNPTVEKFATNEHKIALHRDMNVRKSNVSSGIRVMEVSDEPLEKRKRTQL